MTRDWAPFTDWSEREFWPPRASGKLFGGVAYGPLGERYRRHCRAQLRGLEMRAPNSCTCGAACGSPCRPRRDTSRRRRGSR